MATRVMPQQFEVSKLSSAVETDGLSGSSIELNGASQATMTNLLQSKMKCALTESGYDKSAQQKVVELVFRNIVSCGILLGREDTTSTLAEIDRIRSQLQQILSGGNKINSNEVVLLILVQKEALKSWNDLQAFRDISLATLRDTFGIFPVRVYIGYHANDTKEADTPRAEIGIALLNVVNTDIGGPGMVQLLDNYSTSSTWEDIIVSSEAWNRTDLHWRHERQWKMETVKVPAEVKKSVNVVATPVETEQVQELESAQIVVSQDEHINDAEQSDVQHVIHATSNLFSDEDASRRSSISESPVLIEHPAMIELRARDATRALIQHPSFDHDGESLLDMIRRQASVLPDSEEFLLDDNEEAHEGL